MPDIAREDHGRSLLAKENVVAVFGGTKTKSGVSTGEECLIVLVKKKVPKTSLGNNNDIIPSVLPDGTFTDVVEVGEIAILTAN